MSNRLDQNSSMKYNFTDVEMRQFKIMLEGDLFEHIYLHHFHDTYFLCKDYYTVKDGIVFMVNDDKQQVTGDHLFDIYKDCVKVGKYDPRKTYERQSKRLSHEECSKLLFS